MAGGTQMFISGDGFVSSQTSIVLGSSTYRTSSTVNITYSSISFETLPNQDGSYEATVYVNGFQALCVNNNCSYTFSSVSTPKVTSVSPNTVNSSTLVTINGDVFGTDLSKVHVMIGGEICQVATVQQTIITCNLQALPLGKQAVVVKVDGKL